VTGLFRSWKQEPSPNAWLYDQALALCATTREGQWTNGSAANAPAQAARSLAGFLMMHQKPEGRWSRSWDPMTGSERVDSDWVGDISWMVMALAGYAAKSGDTAAAASAERGAQWLIPRIDGAGMVVGSTEGTVDTW